MKTLIRFLSFVALGSSFALAVEEKATEAEPAKNTAEKMFKKLDVNSDGALSLDEFKVSRMGRTDPGKAAEVFRAKDKDGNGSLSLAELKAGSDPKKVGSEEKKPAPGAPVAPEAPKAAQ